MLGPLRQFLKSRHPTPADALLAVRLMFGLSFWVQIGFVVFVGVGMRLFVGASPQGDTILSPVLLVLGGLELPLALALANAVARAGGKGGALSGATFLGVVLATPAWFALLAGFAGGLNLYTLLLVALLALYYALGFVLAGRFARLALLPKADNSPAPHRADREHP